MSRYNPNRIVSDCCGSNIDEMNQVNGYGRCPSCKEDCIYITQKEFDDNDYDEINTELSMENYFDHPDFLRAEDAKHKNHE